MYPITYSGVKRVEIVKGSDLQHQQLQSSKTGEDYSLSALLTSGKNSEDLFIHHEILEPGRRSSAPHFHAQTDEFIYVLKGSPTAVEGSKEVLLTKGDCATFSKESKEFHFLENKTEQPVEYLVISQCRKTQDVEF